MKEFTLAEFVRKNTQAEAAKVLGCTQGWVSQLLRSNREIYITVSANGERSGYEIRRLKKSASAEAA